LKPSLHYISKPNKLSSIYYDIAGVNHQHITELIQKLTMKTIKVPVFEEAATEQA